MSVANGGVPAMMRSVAVAVQDGGDGRGGKGSVRAVRWAVEHLMPEADRFILVHAIPKITSIPTPSGDCIPVSELNTNIVAMYVQEMRLKAEEVFIPFKKLCKARKMETLVLEGENPAAAILGYISESGIGSFVLGSCSSNCIMRRLKGLGVPSTVLRYAPNMCNIYVVSRVRIFTNLASPSSISGDSKVKKTSRSSSVLGISNPNSEASYMDTSANASVDPSRNYQMLGDELEAMTVGTCYSVASNKTEQSDVQAEVEQLRQELQNTVDLYKRACDELVHAQTKVQLLSSECNEEARRVNAAMEREESLRKTAAEEKVKHLVAMNEVEVAKDLLAKEAYEREIAELNALKESKEKEKVINALFSSDRRYRRYTRDEIEVATDFFSESKVIGEGGYGKVYKCSLDRTPVAVKILQSDAFNKKEEFLREVEVLSQLHHPHMVLLLGACPEIGCLVYEYMENGSLEVHLFSQNGKQPLPWFVRFRIAFEVACGLAFLHNSKPEPIVHRDLKPGNILLDRNYVSKIGDVGQAKLIADIVPDNITEYADSVIAGTLCYMDPEYLRTGTIRTKSDLYAFGIIILQMLTACPPNGLLLKVEDAFAIGCFSNILDKSITDWPLAETEELARIALKCSELRCRDRPDLENDVLPILKRLNAEASAKIERNNNFSRSHFFCPILQEIMDDPHIAADGFTYELGAIKAWLGKYNISPVTKVRLRHTTLTPNHAIHSAIQEWRSHKTYSSA